MPGLSRPFGSVSLLERELDRIGLLHAALLQRVAVRIEDRAAIVLMDADDLVQPRLGRDSARSGRPDRRDLAIEADEFEMAGHLVAEAFAVIFSIFSRWSRRRIHGLQIGDRRIDAQRPQRGVVPAKLDRLAACP